MVVYNVDVEDYQNVCYLIHFDEPLGPNGHYIGFAKYLPDRMAKHRRGEGAAILAECNRRGIGYRVVRVWKARGRETEKQLKGLGSRYLCPVCGTHHPLSPKYLGETLVSAALVSTPR